MEDLTGRWARLSLNTKASQTVKLVDDVIDKSKTLVAKFFIKCRTNLDAIDRTLKSMWRFGGAFEIRDLGANTVLIIFEDVVDVNRILMQGPCYFDKYSIGLYSNQEM